MASWAVSSGVATPDSQRVTFSRRMAIAPYPSSRCRRSRSVRYRVAVKPILARTAVSGCRYAPSLITDSSPCGYACPRSQ